MKLEFEESDVAALRETLFSGWITQGPRVAEFERQFSLYTGARASVAVSSCTAALHLALHVAGIRAGDEVICPSMSFIATANSIVYTGATPVFAEIDPLTWNLDLGDVEKRISPRTKAILLVHQIGMPADTAAFMALAKAHNLILVEDAACAIGSKFRGVPVGAHSGLACFSFHPRKIITTGDGGMVICSDPEQEIRLRALRQHGMSVSDQVRHGSSKVLEEEYSEIGFNYRLTDLQAALGLKQLEKIEEIIDSRRKIAKKYNEAFAEIPALTLLQEPEHVRWNYQSYPMYLNRLKKDWRNRVMQDLLDRGIATRRGIMTAHREPAYSSRGRQEPLPISERVSDQSLLLPLFGSMTNEEVSFVIDSVARACRSVT